MIADLESRYLPLLPVGIPHSTPMPPTPIPTPYGAAIVTCEPELGLPHSSQTTNILPSFDYSTPQSHPKS